MKVYLDNCRSTAVDEEVIRAVADSMKNHYAVPSGLSSIGMRCVDAVKKSQEKIAGTLNVEPENIVFTSGGTESNNLALMGVAYANKGRGRHVLTTPIEHPSIINACEELKRNGFKVDYVRVNCEGFIDLESLEGLLNSETILVALGHVNHVIGTVQPLKEVCEVIKDKNEGTVIHVNAAASYTKVPLDLSRLEIDMVSLSSRKIHGQSGVGALNVEENFRIKPVMHGVTSLSDLRPGHENVPGIVGFAKAAEIGFRDMEENMVRARLLSERLVKSILERIPNSRLIGPEKGRSPYISCLSLLDVEGEAMALQLDFLGVTVSTGSACAALRLKEDYVFQAIGLGYREAHGSIRFCLSKYNTLEEIDYVVDSVVKAHSNLARISVFKG